MEQQKREDEQRIRDEAKKEAELIRLQREREELHKQEELSRLREEANQEAERIRLKLEQEEREKLEEEREKRLQIESSQEPEGGNEGEEAPREEEPAVLSENPNLESIIAPEDEISRTEETERVERHREETKENGSDQLTSRETGVPTTNVDENAAASSIPREISNTERKEGESIGVQRDEARIDTARENELLAENSRLTQELAQLKDEITRIETTKEEKISELRKANEQHLHETVRVLQEKVKELESENERLRAQGVAVERSNAESAQLTRLVEELKEQVETLNLERTIFEKRWDKDQEEIRNLKKNVRSPLLSSDYLQAQERVQSQTLEIVKIEKAFEDYKREQKKIVDNYESEAFDMREKYQQKCVELEDMKLSFENQLEEQRNLLISQYMSQLEIEKKKLRDQYVGGQFLMEEFARNNHNGQLEFNPAECKRNTQSEEEESNEKYEAKSATQEPQQPQPSHEGILDFVHSVFLLVFVFF
jgi:hypothetical protein